MAEKSARRLENRAVLAEFSKRHADFGSRRCLFFHLDDACYALHGSNGACGSGEYLVLAVDGKSAELSSHSREFGFVLVERFFVCDPLFSRIGGVDAGLL